MATYSNQELKNRNIFFYVLSNRLLTPAFKPGISMGLMLWASALIESGINGNPIMAKAWFCTIDSPGLKAGVS